MIDINAQITLRPISNSTQEATVTMTLPDALFTCAVLGSYVKRWDTF